MCCLTHEQIVQLAMGSESHSDLSTHLEACACCRKKFTAMSSLFEQLSTVHAQFDRGHEESRVQLISKLATIDRSSPPEIVRWHFLYWQGSLIMKRRIAFGIVGIFGVLVFASLWMLSSGKSVSAMEQMAESIRTAKSYTLTMVSEVQYIPEPGKPPVTEEVTVKMFGLAPGSLRIEYLFPAERSKHPNGSNDGHLNERDLKVGRVAILSASKETIDIDHRAKTYRRGPARREQPPIMMFTELSKYSGQAKRELGTKELHGKKALGFVIDCEKVDGLGTGEAEIWIDAKSKLPIELRIEDRLGKAGDKLQMGDMRSKERLDGFEWNIDLDPKLFDVTPPDGYVENTLNALPRL